MNPFMLSRITRWLSSFIGMVFMGAGLFAAIWSNSDPWSIAQRVLYSGVIGLIVGFLTGQVITVLLKERLDQENETVIQETQGSNGQIQEQVSSRRLEPWNPPQVEIEESKEA